MLVYGVSKSDDVAFTGYGWDAFARENAGESVLGEAVVGRTLWDFVNGSATRHFLEQVFFDCRRSGEAATLVYRCDGPGVERLYCQHIIPGTNGTLRLESRLVRARPLLTAAMPDRTPGWRRCSICLSMSTDGAWWLPPGKARVGTGVSPAWAVCPACHSGAVTRHHVPAPMVPA